MEGCGVTKSSVSRHWKVATATERETLCQRPVPKELEAPLIDGQYFLGECLVAAGVDRAGRKHVPGLWHGATGNNAPAPAVAIKAGAGSLLRGERVVHHHGPKAAERAPAPLGHKREA